MVDFIKMKFSINSSVLSKFKLTRSRPIISKLKMSKKLWVAYETPSKTIVDKVSIDGCSDVDDILQEIKKKSQLLSIPQNTPITLYQPDGTTGIDVGDSPYEYLDGNSRKNPLIVKTKDLPSLKSGIKEKAEFQLYSWKAKRKPFQVLRLDLHNGRIPLDALLAHEKILHFFQLIKTIMSFFLLTRMDLAFRNGKVVKRTN